MTVTQKYLHTHIHTQTDTVIHTHPHTHRTIQQRHLYNTETERHPDTHLDRHTHIHSHTQSHTQTYRHTQKQQHTSRQHAHTHTHTHTHTQTDTHTHTQTDTTGRARARARFLQTRASPNSVRVCRPSEAEAKIIFSHFHFRNSSTDPALLFWYYQGKKSAKIMVSSFLKKIYF